MISTETLSAQSDRHSVVLSRNVFDALEFLLAESLALNASSVPESFAGPGYKTIPGMTRGRLVPSSERGFILEKSHFFCGIRSET